ncbi:DUF881 domain-containing protein [Gracilibacillus alcaliphilus]|uniref:DUF881 domain-containing protein n=1 Tax=Gracilibacillus alcaliphilus TaxID=1401441 RepID=UPI001957678B|nr:DUF881 domain-containing protein [Gracilibacillus alcaliphilus]MBM7678619.1 uncharacterized protein YlxW (UPF0749 family) [Gracilibacillus alcaliphilus]
MKKRIPEQAFMLSFICLLIGFMVAILFNSNNHPEGRDTRDTWEIRTALLEEQQVQQDLYQEIRKEEEMLNEYQEQSEHQQMEAIKESIETLRTEAGLSEKSGTGVEISLLPLFLNQEKQAYPTLHAEFLHQLINQLNAAGAEDIAIENQRLIAISPIRMVNGSIYVNNSSIGDLPYIIHVLAEDVEKLKLQLESSEIHDYFALEDVEIEISEPQPVTLPPYDEVIDLQEIHTQDNLEKDEE